MSRPIAASRESAERDAGSARTVRRVCAVLGFAVLTAVGARISVPLPGSPVPFTFQVVAVLAAGLLLGPRLGAASQLTYLAAGAAGLPVFAMGGGAAYLLGPTGGYLLAYPAAALVVGLIANRRESRILELAALLAGSAVIFVGGAAWLAATIGPAAALRTGVLPFVGVDLLKVALVFLVGRKAARPLRRFVS